MHFGKIFSPWKKDAEASLENKKTGEVAMLTREKEGLSTTVVKRQK